MNQSLSEVIINQSNYLIIFDTQLKTALNTKIAAPTENKDGDDDDNDVDDDDNKNNNNKNNNNNNNNNRAVFKRVS